MLSFNTRQESLLYGQKTLIVSPNGAIDKRSVRQFEKQIEDYITIGHRLLVLNCEGINSINSTGLQVLLKMVETYQKAGGMLLLIKVLPPISKFFDMLGFSPIFTSFTTDKEALQYLNEQLKQISESQASNTEQPAQSDANVASSPSASAGQQETVSYVQNSSQNIRSDVQPPVKKIMPQMDIQIGYYGNMAPLDIFPVTIIATPLVQHPTQELEDFHVIPCFPGCLAIPNSRVVFLGQSQEITFWITPFVSKDIKSCVEFRQNDQTRRIWLKCKSKTQRWSKLFLLSGIIVFLAKSRLEHVYQSMLNMLEGLSLQIPRQYLEITIPVSLLLLAIVSYLAHRPRKAKNYSERLNFNQ